MKPKNLIKQGNAYFRAASFQQAADCYKLVIANGFSEPLLAMARFNLALMQRRLGVSFDDSPKPLGHTAYTLELVESFARASRSRDASMALAILRRLSTVGDPDTLSKTEVLSKIRSVLQRASDQSILNDYLSGIQALFNRGVRARIIFQGEGILLLRQKQFDAAKKTWARYIEQYSEPTNRQEPFLKLHARANPPPFKTIKKHLSFDVKANTKICVYTAMFGGYDAINTPLTLSEDIDFICFSDGPVDAKGWRVIVVDPLDLDSIQANRYYKINPHLVLPGYDFSLYIDGNILVAGMLDKLATSLAVHGVPFAAFRHPERDDIYTEIEAILSSCRTSSVDIIDQLEFFHQQAAPRYSGQIEACFLWRSHHDQRVRDLMEAWWTVFLQYGARDQALLAYLMASGHLKPVVISGKFGTTRESDFAVKLPHLHLLETQAAATALHQADHIEEVPRSKKFATCRKRVAWVYSKKHQNVASTLMRGKQLQELVKRGAPTLETAYVERQEAKLLSGWTLIFTKGALKETSSEELLALRNRNNRILADFVDDPVRLDIVDAVDGLVAASIRQLIWCRRTVAHRPTFHITHHVDQRIRPATFERKTARVGYFGELVNAAYSGDLSGYVDFVSVDTKISSDDWVSFLANYGYHYAVRNRRPIDGFKPFLKGFTAAHSGACIITSKCEGDALFYLTAEYPYLVDSHQAEAVKTIVQKAKESFGSEEWKFAQEIMGEVRRRSSDEQVVKEVLNALQ